MRSLAGTLLLGVTLLWLAARLPLWLSFDASPRERAARDTSSPEQPDAVADYEASCTNLI
jgi:hypothetical protein